MLKANFNKIKIFFVRDIWEVKLSALSSTQAWLFRQIRILVITFKEYNDDKCVEKASSLTYYTLLSVVPVIAIAFGIATAFGLEGFLREELVIYFSGQQEVLEYMLDFADSALNNTSGGVISGISSVFLIYAVARLFHNIEVSFNSVWNTLKGRTLQRKLSDYMSIILLGPIILILSSTATVFITTQVEILTREFGLMGSIKGSIMFLINLIPYTLIWILFFLIYIIFPSTKVNAKPAFIAGVLAGTVYQLTQWAYITFQVGVSSYSTIYGSFAAFPLFLIWVNISWLIVLFGAEYAYAAQNVNRWKITNNSLRINYGLRKRLYLLLVKMVADNFRDGNSTSFQQIEEEINLPTHILSESIHELITFNLIVKLDSDNEELYQPAFDIHQMNISNVLEKVENEGIEAMSLKCDNELELQSIESKLNEMQKKTFDNGGNTRLIDL
ncbi:MAG: YihY/virulence factor BrkB family protein [Cyclobacteriaceae bacterium]